jgi:SAM-dependent methyltransferase
LVTRAAGGTDVSTGNPWNEVAQLYEDIRPSYPDQLIQDLVETTRVPQSGRLLEIGAGTGKATVQLAKRGYRIRCIEPGENLAGILIAKCSCYPSVRVDVASFEEWTPDEDPKFDLIFCAQAFNWLDPKIRYRKCHELLDEGGHLALFWYGHEDEHWESEIVASGLFHNPRVFEYHSEFASSAESQVEAIESTSWFVALDEEAQSRMRDETRSRIEQQGGTVTARLDYRMYVAEKA